MKIGIVVINWNGLELLKKYLKVLIQNSVDHNIYLIDNNSEDESVSFVRNNYSEVNIINLDKNYGFAEGYNRGILKVKVTKCGAGFRELPEVYINTETGLNVFLIPVLKFHRENFDEFPEGTAVLQVVDCVGNTGPNARTSVT